MAFWNKTITIRRPPSPLFDEYGDPTSGSATDIVVTGCAVAPQSSVLPGGVNTAPQVDRGRLGVVTGLTLFVPFGTDIRRTDQVVVDGVLFDVEGDPGSWSSAFTSWEPGIAVELRRGAG